MTIPPRRNPALGLLAGAAGVLTAVVGASAALSGWQGIARVQRHGPPGAGAREVHIAGVARAPAPGTPGRAASRPAPSGRSCLAWTYSVVGSRRQSGQKSSSERIICSDRSTGEFQVEAPGGARFLYAGPEPGDWGRWRPLPRPTSGCVPLPSDTGVQTSESCLQDGDRIDVWACQQDDRLVACLDGLDQLSVGRTPDVLGHARFWLAVRLSVLAVLAVLLFRAAARGLGRPPPPDE